MIKIWRSLVLALAVLAMAMMTLNCNEETDDCDDDCQEMCINEMEECLDRCPYIGDATCSNACNDIYEDCLGGS